MWVLIVSSSMLWFNHLEYKTKEECLYHAEQILNVDMGPRDLNRKPLSARCVKKLTKNSVK